MSFSSDIKEEILKNFSKCKNTCCIKAERFGEYLVEAQNKYELESQFKELFDISKLKECCIKSILKGCFLGGGCIVNPNTDYHFELTIKNKACAEYIFNLLSVLEFTPKLLKRKNTGTYVVYIKDSEQISLFLSLVEANTSMLKFEEIRVEKQVKNNINRTINCEAANLAKTIKSSIKQIEAIEKIKKAGKFDNLNEKLKYAASLRLKYKNESLDYISNKTKEKGEYISKSGLKHRFDKILQIADSI